MVCSEIKFESSDCCENNMPKIKGVYVLKDGSCVYIKSNGGLFIYQNNEAGLKALKLVQKYEIWQVLFKPQSQRVINVIIITGIVLALAEIVWFWLTKY